MRNTRQVAGEVVTSGRIVERASGRMHSSMTRLMRFMGQQFTGTVRSFFYGMRMGMVGAGVAVSAFVVTSLRSFRDFDKKLRETTALIAGANTGGKASNLKGAFKEAEKNYKDFYKFLLRTAPQMRRTPQDLAGGLYELVQAGLSPKASKALLRPAAMGATAGGGNVDQSARVLVQIMNALRMGTSRPGAGKAGGQVMDKIFQAINLGVGVDFNTLSTGIGKFIGSAGVTFKGGRGRNGKGGGMSALNELLATYIFSTQQGARTSDVGVGIQDVIKTIANPSAKGARFAKSIGLGGLGSGFLQQHGFVGSLETIIQKMKDAGYTGAKLNDAIGKLFGDVRGRRIVAYATNLNMVKTALDSMGLSANATQRSFDEQGKSLDAVIQTFQSYWETLKIGLGQSLAPTLRSGMGRITNVLTSAGVVGRGPELMDQYSRRTTPASRKRFLSRLSAEDRVSLQSAQRFDQAGFGGKVKQIADRAMTSFQAWWNSPQTQSRFSAAIHSMIQRSFDMLGRMIQLLPSVYKFGRKVAGEIVRGVLDGLKEAVKNIFGGGGGHGFGGFGISSDPFQAVGMGALGYGFARNKIKGSPLQAMLGAGGGGLIAGLDPVSSAILAVASGANRFSKLRREKKGAAPGTTATSEMVATMNVQAATVNIIGGRMGGGGGGLAPGYIGGVNKRGKPYYQDASGKFVSRTTAMGGQLSNAEAEALLVGGGTADPAKKGLFSRLFGSGRIASKLGGLGGRMGMGGGLFAAGSAALTLAPGLIGAAQGKSTNWTKMAGSGLTAAGSGLLFGAPEIGIPLIAAGMGLDWLGGRGGGDKKKTAAQMSAYQRLFAPQIPTNLGTAAHFTPTIPAKPRGARLGGGFTPVSGGGLVPATPAGPTGFGAKFGKGGGFNVAAMSTVGGNLGGFGKDFYYSGKRFYELLDLVIKTPFDKPDLAQARFEKAYGYAQSSQTAVDMLAQAANEWQSKSVEANARRHVQAREKKAKAARHVDDTREANRLPPGPDRRFNNAKDHRTSIGQAIPGKIWGKIATDQKKPAQTAASDGFKFFQQQFEASSKVLPEQMKPAIVAMINSVFGVSSAAINGVGSTPGPANGAPPSTNATGSSPTDAGTPTPIRGGGGRTFSSAGIKGIGGELGGAMGVAGADLAKKMADHAADAITKKQLQGPLSGAYKALQWLYRQVGKPYIWGGGHPPNANLKGYDCSGLSSTALMVAGSHLAGNTYSMIPNTSAGGGGPIRLGFNDPVHPSHMGIQVLGKWFEARGHATPILGPGKARTQWPYVGTPKMHSGGVFDSHTTRGEGPAILKDGEMVVRGAGDGGLQAHPVAAGGGYFINGPLIQHATIRDAHDVHLVAQELANLLEKKKQNSATVAG